MNTEKSHFLAKYGNAEQITKHLLNRNVSDYSHCAALENEHLNSRHIDLVVKNPDIFGVHVMNRAIEHPLTTVDHLKHIVNTQKKSPRYFGTSYIRARQRLEKMGYDPDEGDDEA